MAVALAFAALPAAAHASAGPVTVQVEGKLGVQLGPSAVTTTTTPLNKTGVPGQTCPGTSAIGALELLTAGDWSGTWNDSFGYSVERIGAEGHDFSSGRYWAFYVNGLYQTTGACQAELQTGDDVLFFPACAGAASGCYTGEPLTLRAPGTVRPGEAFTVTVLETKTILDENYNLVSTTLGASEGATVSGGGATATTDAQGVARLTVAGRGPLTLIATKGDDVPDRVPLCATDGADGSCGTTVPGAAPAAAASQCATDGADGLCGTTDRRPPRAKIGSIREGQRFARGRGPRLLEGIVTSDPSGLAAVRLRLTRTDRGRCTTFDARRERLVAMARCGAARGRWFSVGDRETWSYLLPARLGRGRYVLDVEVADRAGNVDRLLQRTRTRVVFHVR